MCIRDRTKTEDIDMIDHDYVETVVAPTCVDEGYTVLKCSVCGAETGDKTNIVPATGEHTASDEPKVVAPTCAEEGYSINVCAVCGEEFGEKFDIVPATGEHVYVDGYCEVCGAKKPADTSDSNSIFATTAIVSVLAAAAIVCKKKLF